MHKYFLLILFQMSSWCHQLQNPSLINLIANPEKFHDKEVVVKGYFHFEFENHRLFISKESSNKSIVENGVKIIFMDVAQENAFRRLNNHFIEINGKFIKERENSKNGYHFYIYQIIRWHALK